MTELSGLTLGRYRLLEPLVEGPMAAVYRAYDTRVESVVAVKIIRTKTLVPGASEQTLQSFLREAESMVHLTHPHIVKVTDYGEYQAMPYLVMADLPLRTLEQWLGRPIPWEEAVRLLAPIAHALAYAHEQGVLHRDLQPSNILLTAKGQPMLADFGVATLFDSVAAGHLIGAGKGTLDYIAPEQWHGGASAQTNIYSLGVILFEMVTGRKPYRAHTPGALLPNQADGPLPRAKSLVFSVPDAVDDVLLKALAKKPEDRYPDMGAMAAALDTLAAIPLGAPPAFMQERSRWEQRAAESATSIDTAVMGASGIGAAAPAVGPGGTIVLPTARRSSLLLWALALGGLVVAAALALFVLAGVLPKGPAGSIPAAAVSIASQAQEPAGIPSAAAYATPQAMAEISDGRGVSMRLVSGGNFVMGSSAAVGVAECLKLSSPDWSSYTPGTCVTRFDDEEPPHSIYLDSFYMDKYEVSNTAYRACVKEGACLPPTSRDSAIHFGYFEDPRYAEYPVIYVNWSMASAYCAWRGARLPTEAEWEKAARGADSRKYPWGDSFGQMKANFCDSQCPEPWNLGTFFDGYAETAPVDAFGSGASPYGILNLAGNVWEWVSDEYNASYQANSPASDPSAQPGSDRRVARGGSWQDPGWATLASFRFSFPASQSGSAIGFRCARSE
jgi:formylglycine-generating enzyme required for sulfatase activity